MDKNLDENPSVKLSSDKSSLSFEKLDLGAVQLLNSGQIEAAINLIEKELANASHPGEKILLSSRLIALAAIAGNESSLQKIPSLLSSMLDLTSVNSNDRNLLNTAFTPLLNRPAVQNVTFSQLPFTFTNRTGDLPIYENKLELVETTSEDDQEWLRLKGKRSIRNDLDVFLKKIITNTVLAPEGVNIYEQLAKYEPILSSDILKNSKIIKDVSIDDQGNFQLSLKNICPPGELKKELNKHLGTFQLLDTREASDIAGYEEQNDTIVIKEFAENELGEYGHADFNVDHQKEAIQKYREKNLKVAHLHTHPSPDFFSFTDVSENQAEGITGDLATYFGMNDLSDKFKFSPDTNLYEQPKPIAGIVLIGYNTGFIYDPENGTRILKII